MAVRSFFIEKLRQLQRKYKRRSGTKQIYRKVVWRVMVRQATHDIISNKARKAAVEAIGNKLYNHTYREEIATFLRSHYPARSLQ
jgi:hypothetical protein